MLSQIESSCLSGAIDLLSELTTSLEQSDTYSVTRKGKRDDLKKVGPTSPENWQASGSSLGKQEIQSIYIEINQQLSSALSSTSLQAESLKKQLHQAKSSRNNEVTD